MKLLAIDTTEDACSAALLFDGDTVERFELAPRRHSELILPMMDGLLADAGLRIGDLDALAFGCGPGAFTGVRIATAIVQGAALGADLPVVPVSSLQALAQGTLREHATAAVLAAFDARMGEVYWGAFRVDAGGIMRAAGAEGVYAPNQVAVPAGDDWVGSGSGWQAYADQLAARLGDVRRCHGTAMVHACDVAQLAAVLYAEGAGVAASQAQPVYLRNQVAWAKS